MQVETSSATPFPSLPESLPSRTLTLPVKQPSAAPEVADSPTSDILDLPKNAYGLESFADYCAAVNRTKAGLPATEAVASPDLNKPLIIHGVEFKYWNPEHPESEISDTDSEITAIQPSQVQNGSVKSTWSAGSPRKSILRQSMSLPPINESEQPLLDERQNQLVYDYASSASPSSRHTHRLSSRRVSMDAGVQSEPMEAQNSEEEVVRVAAAKRLSARRSSIVPVRRGSRVHGLAGFTGIGRADSGAVICIANGKKFELFVHSDNIENDNEKTIQCSGLEIDSEIEALFGQKSCEDVIDVDAEDENPEPGDKPSEEAAGEDEGQGNDSVMKADAQDDERDEVPSPEQLRSNNISFKMMTPIAVSPRSDEQDATFTETFHDELVAKSALTAHKRVLPPPTSTLKARVSAPPLMTASEPTGNLPESQPDIPSPETAPPAVKFVGQPRQTPEKIVEQQHETAVQAIADPTKTPSQSITLGIVRQRSLSLKPTSEVRLTASVDPVLTVHGRTLHIGAVRGVDIHPTASAYQLAAMATLSPRSYLRAIQPSQSRVVFAFASPGGTGPVRGVNVAPPNLTATPPVATLGVVPNTVRRGSLVVAPRRSQVSMPRIEMSPSRHGLRASSGVHKGTGSSADAPNIDHETAELITPAPLQRSGHNPDSVYVASHKTERTVHSKEKHTAPSRTGAEANRASSSALRSPGMDEHQVDFVDDGDDDFDALPDMDDDGMEVEVEPHIEPTVENTEQETAKECATKSRSRKTSTASSRTHGSRKTKQSSGSEQRRSSSVTQVVKGTSGGSSDADFSLEHVETTEIVEPEEERNKEESDSKKKHTRKGKSQRKQTKKGGQKTTKHTGKKRWRELKSLPTEEVSLNEGSEDGGLRRSKRQRFPRLKFWKNETVSYERRLSQAIPTIAEVVLEVGGSESSDDDTWFGRR